MTYHIFYWSRKTTAIIAKLYKYSIKRRRSSMVTHWVAVVRIRVQVSKLNQSHYMHTISPDPLVVWEGRLLGRLDTQWLCTWYQYRERHSLWWLNLGHLLNDEELSWDSGSSLKKCLNVELKLALAAIQKCLTLLHDD